MITLQNISKTFGRFVALDDISFSVGAGERVAIVGLNGAGKTTLLRVLATFLPPTSGSGCIGGCDLYAQADLVRRKIGYLPESAPLYEDMTVARYLKFRGRLKRLQSAQLSRMVHEVLSICDIGQWRNTPIGKLSHGLRHRVAIADCLIHEPDVLLLDDPFAASDIHLQESMLQLFRNAEAVKDTTIVFTTHNAALISDLATRVVLIEHGRLAADTTDATVFRDKPLADIFASLDALANQGDISA